MNPFALFQGASLLTKVAAVAGLLALLGTAYGVWHYKVYTRGYNAAIAAIAAQDKRAIDAAVKARGNYNACVTDGGVWDQSTGECDRR